MRNMLCAVEDPRIIFSQSHVYEIPCSCGSFDFGTTRKLSKIGTPEHKRSCRPSQYEKSAVGEHA